MKVDTQKGRIIWIDIFKAVAISCIVIQHMDISRGLYCFVSFAIYGFYFIGGVTYKEEDNINKATKKNFRQLMIPFYHYASLWLAFYFLQSIDWSRLLFETAYLKVVIYEGVHMLGKGFLMMLYGTDGIFSEISLGPAWFLVSLFVVRTLYNIVRKMAKGNKRIVDLVCLLAFLVGVFLDGKCKAPLSLFQSLTAFVFFHLGTYLDGGQMEEMMWKKKKSSLLLFGVLSCLGWMGLSVGVNETLVLIRNDLPKNLLSLIGATCFSIIAMVSISCFLARSTVAKKLIMLGQASMTIMGIHSIIRVVVYNITMRWVGIEQVLINVFLFLITMLICTLIFKQFCSVCPILVGRKIVKNEKKEC